MGLFLLLSVVGLVIWTTIAGLARRVAALEQLLTANGTADDRLTAIAARVTALEALATRTRLAEPSPATVTMPAPVLTPRPAAPPDRPAVPTPPTPPPVPPAARVTTGLSPTPIAAPLPKPSLKPDTIDRPVAAASAEPSPLMPVAPPAEPAAASTDTWEVVVGTSWLNKIGVLIFVTGLALLLGYSMTHIGPAGRVLMGFAIGAAMLGAGVTLERRPPYRAFGLGLVAGGWAGLYVTAFAMHALPAARIVESHTVGVLTLLAVAAGMVAHTLRYRSEVVTSLAYVSAYLPLVITPLPALTVTASIPLAISLLTVSSRFGWTTLSVLGVVSTYGLLVLRGTVLPGEPLDGSTAMAYLVLGMYWLVFEAADLVGLRLNTGDRKARAPLFAVNAVGYLGVFVSFMGTGSTALLFTALVVTALAYLASALIRARLAPASAVGVDSTAFTTVHAALALSAALTAWAIDIRLAGPREALVLLVEAELLLAASMTLADRQIRRIAVALACLVSLHGLVPVLTAGNWPAVTGTMAAWSPVWALMSLAFYANREWLRHRGAALDPIEHGLPWVALAFLGLVIGDVFVDASRGLAGLVLAYVLTEAGRRHRPEYLWQSRAALVAAIPILAGPFLTNVDAETMAWRLLPAAAGVSYLLAWRHRSAPSASPPAGEAAAASPTGVSTDSLITAVIAASAGTAFVVLLEMIVTPEPWVLIAWTATSLALVSLGAVRRISLLRWHAYALFSLAAIPVFVGLALGTDLFGNRTVTSVVTIAALFLGGYIGRRVSTHPFERVVAGLVALVGTAVLTLFKWRVLPEMYVAPAWAVESLVLVALGRARFRAGQRWQGYAASMLALGYASYWAAQQIAVAVRLAIEPPMAVPVAMAAVVLAAFATTALGRTRPTSEATRSAAPDLEGTALIALPAFATYFLTVFEVAWFGDAMRPLALALTAAGLFAGGLATRAIDIRILGYAIFAASASAVGAVIGRPADVPLLGSILAVAVFFATSLLSRRPLAAATEALGRDVRRFEEAARVGLSVVAAVLTAWLVAADIRPSLVTMAWGVEGIALLGVGFALRERSLRLLGLALLFLCILKLFLYDLRELDALARILSFVALGLVLLGVSWTYTKYKQELKRLL